MLSKRSFISRKLNITTFIIIILYVTLNLVQSHPTIDDDRKIALEQIERAIKSQSSHVACKIPDLPVNSEEMKKFVKYVPPISCTSAVEDWVICKNSECIITEKAKARYGNIICSFTDLIRKDDHHSTTGNTVNSVSYYKLEASDVVSVSCKSHIGNKWKSVLTSIRFDKGVHDRTSWSNLPKNAMKLNVLMFGFDSLSRNAVIRHLPNSYAYLTKTLETIVLEGYNIVGDGTPQALIPILTGQTELELPEVRKRIRGSGFCDQYPFIWKDYIKNGYATGYMEDIPSLGTFTYRLNGFKRQPTDHYMRPYYIEGNSFFENSPKLCAGSVPRHKVMMNNIKSFFTVYKKKPKFMFGFHTELSHSDYNLISVVDDDLLAFLKDLRSSGILNNTLLILMSDHGNRYAEIRYTVQGKQEERLPFFSFTFPPWFRTKYKEAYDNFVSNSKRLTTPFDIYPTLKDILNLQHTGEADLSKRSVSLFTKIPAERSCADAHIEPHWCTCLDWYDIPLSLEIASRLGDTLVTFLNNYTQSHRNKCAPLSISRLVWVKVMVPNDNLLKFNKNKDMDGFVADMNGKTVIKSNTYQIKAIMLPGDSHFEATITHFVDNDHLQLKLTDISRTNMYGKQARCIEKEYPHLRNYCYCV